MLTTLNFKLAAYFLPNTCTVKPVLTATCIKRVPPLSGHFIPPQWKLLLDAPVLSVNLSNAASQNRPFWLEILVLAAILGNFADNETKTTAAQNRPVGLEILVLVTILGNFADYETKTMERFQYVWPIISNNIRNINELKHISYPRA